MVLNATTGVFSGTGSGTAHAFAPARSGTGTAVTANVNFGWNFNTIVNRNDTGQGSLRQFITERQRTGPMPGSPFRASLPARTCPCS